MAGPTFIEWLHAEVSADPGRTGHFAALYPFGPYLDAVFGSDEPELPVFASYLERESYPASEIEELCRKLTLAVATWRTDSLMPGTAAPAIPTPECGFRGIDGVPCANPAVEGAARCVTHGGAITDPHARASMLLVAYAQMVAGADTAVSTLLDVMERSNNDLARVQAAKEMLDRAGLAADQHVTISAVPEGRGDTLDRIKNILDQTRERLLPPAEEGAPPEEHSFDEDDEDIVEAELVD